MAIGLLLATLLNLLGIAPLLLGGEIRKVHKKWFSGPAWAHYSDRLPSRSS